MVVDWHPLPANGTARVVRGLLAVAPKADVTARLNAVRAVGASPAVVDVEGLALWNAYWALVGSRQTVHGTALLLNVGARSTNLVIASAPDELLLVRDLRFGGRELEAGAERDWAAEIQDSISYARSRTGLRRLTAAYLTGGSSSSQLVPLLEGAAATPVTLWNPLEHLARDPLCPLVEPSVGPLLAVAIGLALRQPS